MTATDTHRAIDAVWRIEAPKIIAALGRMVRDVGLAEDLAQDALVAALEQWPASGIPRNPGAWLMATAKHRAIDGFRRNKLLERKHEELGYEIQRTSGAPDFDGVLDDDVGDDLLRLIFTACHPVLSTDARVALTLRLLGGLTTDEIARAFLVSEPTIAQRIVRAKRTLASERVAFEIPIGAERDARLSSVLEVIYLVFNEGYTATAGDDSIVELNRAVAVAMAFGPQDGLKLVDALRSEPSLQTYRSSAPARARPELDRRPPESYCRARRANALDHSNARSSPSPIAPGVILRSTSTRRRSQLD